MIARRSLLVAGGAGVGLLVAWAAWPRDHGATLPAGKGETAFGAWLRIAESGVVTVAIPQAECGQGVYTALPQIVADELGADWRTVAVEAAPIGPVYANPLAADALFGGALARVPDAVRREHMVRSAALLTAGSTSVRMFEGPLRQAGAAARVLLAKAAAARWGIDWEACDTEGGFVVAGNRRLRFADLAAEAAGGDLPAELPLRLGDEGRLTGRALPRLDAPAKVDGSANFAGDVRLPDMVFASVCAGPVGDTRLVRVDRAAAEAVRGVVAVVENERWAAAVGNDWWAANRGLAALAPRFATRGRLADDAAIDAALARALGGEGYRIAAVGDLAATFRGARLLTADYDVAPGLHAALETPAATAWWHGDRLELWAATAAPNTVRHVAADAIGVDPARVTVHPMLVGGHLGGALEPEAARQAAMLAVTLRRPVQLTWSRAETTRRDPVRAPARARMAARLDAGGAILGWQAKIAAPASGAALARRLLPHDPLARAAAALPAGADLHAMSGAVPPYRIPALAIDHHPADLPLAVGHCRGGADGYTAFFTECFLDELAIAAGMEPMSYRVGMLGGNPRLVRCLTTAASLGGWDGGRSVGERGGAGQGIACHQMAGSMIAVVAEASVGAGGRPKVERIVAAVDCGRAINPDIARQQIEGGLVIGIAQATGAATGFARGLATAGPFGTLGLPRLADTPDITVELIASEAEPGGVSDLAIPPVAPAIANALRAATGQRPRRLPLGRAA